MTNEIQIFSNSEFGNIRTINENGKVLFCGKDIAEVLGYKNVYDALSQHCPSLVKREVWVRTGVRADGTTAKRNTEMSFIPEGDVIRLILRSTLPSAQKFERWVCDEIVPSVLHTGSYSITQQLPQTYLEALEALVEKEKERIALTAKIEEDKPKVDFYHAVGATDNDIIVRDMAKLLCQNGFDIGEKRLFAQLREKGYLIKAKPDWNRPTQRAMELGLFRVQEKVLYNEIGNPSRTIFTTKVTPKGQQYFLKAFQDGTF